MDVECWVGSFVTNRTELSWWRNRRDILKFWKFWRVVRPSAGEWSWAFWSANQFVDMLKKSRPEVLCLSRTLTDWRLNLFESSTPFSPFTSRLCRLIDGTGTTTWASLGILSTDIYRFMTNLFGQRWKLGRWRHALCCCWLIPAFKLLLITQKLLMEHNFEYWLVGPIFEENNNFIHQSIALETLYQKSFKSDSIKLSSRRQIPFELRPRIPGHVNRGGAFG